MARQPVGGMALCLVATAVLAGIAAYHTRDALNPDAVAYGRIAGYYARGELDLAVSQYWSPLFSWLLVPLAPWFADPVHLGRAGMVVSALVFVLGAYAVLGLVADPVARRIGAALVVVFAVMAVGREIAPDLLMAGLFAPAVARAVDPRWRERRGGAFASGVLFGAAFLAKGVALAGGVLVLAAVAGLRVVVHREVARVARALGWTALGFALLAVPWLGLLSARAGRPTMGATAAINLAVAGPKDVDRFHPTFRTLHVPASGRLTSWEAPDELPYRTWSLAESPEHRAFWFEWVRRNAAYVLSSLASFDLGALGLACVLLALCAHVPWRAGMATEAWRWSALGVVFPAVLYIPFLASSTRYYYSAYPFLVVAALGVARSLIPSGGLAAARTLALVVGGSFLGVSLPSAARTVLSARPDVDTVDARRWGAAVRAAGALGPIASVGPSGHTALYAAALTGQPFAGNVLSLDDPQALAGVGARVVFVQAEAPAVPALAGAPGFVHLAPPAGASGRQVVFVRQP